MMQSQNQDPRFILDEKTRKEREEQGQILKHEDELQDISNMDLSKFKQNKTDQLMDKSKELRNKAEEQISNVKSKISEKSENLKERAAQKENEFSPKGQGLQQKAQEYFNKASEKASEIKKGTKENKKSIEKTQVHHGERPLTEQTKHDILELTEKLTQKVQALKQIDQRAQSETTPSSQVQTQNLKQTYSAPQQEKLESQPSTKNQETKFEKRKEEQPQSRSSEQKEPEIKEQEQVQKHTERKPLVDQVLGRIHSASDNLHHKIDDFKSAFKVEEPKDTDRVPLVDQLAHSIHNVTDRITGVFKHKGKTTKTEKDQSKYHSSKSLSEKEPLGEISGSVQEKDLTEKQQGIGEGGLGSYLIGEEFRENLEGFSRTMESGLQEEGSKTLEEKEYSLGRFEQEEKETDQGAEHLKIQGVKEFRKEELSGSSELKDNKSEEKSIFSEGRSSDSGLQGSQDISTSAEGTSTPPGSRRINILKQLEEDIKLIDRLLEKTIERGAKYESKGVNTSSSSSFKKSQGFGNLSNQSAEIGTNTSEGSSLTRQVYQDVNASDKLLEGAILGDKSVPKESSESSATNLYSKSSKPRTEVFRDITNEVAGSLSQKAEKDLNNNDKLLDESIREGKSGFRVESEDKENIGKKRPSMSGANISHCDGMRDLIQTL